MSRSIVDVVYPLQGRTLPPDHRQALADALTERVPWLARHDGWGLHRINLAAPAAPGQPALLSQRSRLGLRVPREAIDALAALDGATLEVEGHLLHLGRASLRELLPHTTLYAHFVVAVGDDEAAFLGSVSSELAALAISGRCICGRAQVVRQRSGPALRGFSLMVDHLSVDDSLRLLEHGLGAQRRLGGGLFVPHRSAAAVGA